MKYVLTIVLLFPSILLGADEQNEYSDLALGLASEELLVNLHNCLKTAEQQGKYEACNTARNYYVNLKHLMKDRDLSKMDTTRRIRIEKRLAIIESLQVR